jgi:hypothetical protein
MPLITMWLILNDTAESGRSLLVDLLVGQQLRVIEEIPQEPAQLPHCLLGTVKTTDNGLPGQNARFEDGKAMCCISGIIIS